MKFGVEAVSSYLSLGNNAFIFESYGEAISYYFQGMHSMPELVDNFIFGIENSRRHCFLSSGYRVGVVLTKKNPKILKQIQEFVHANSTIMFSLFGVNLSFKNKFDNVVSGVLNFPKIDIHSDFDAASEFVLNNPLSTVLVLTTSLDDIAWAILYKAIWGATILIANELTVIDENVGVKTLSPIGERLSDYNLEGKVDFLDAFEAYSDEFLTALYYKFPAFDQVHYFNEKFKKSRNSILLSGKCSIYLPEQLLIQNKDIISDILNKPLIDAPKRFFPDFDWVEQESFLLSILNYGRSNFNANLPKVSIIMPSYNRGDMISDAINSVVSQTYLNWQLIIVDDGSSDNTQEVIGLYSDNEKISYIEGQHKGVSFARNLGLSVADGDYIFYLDSDNSWNSCYLEVMIYSFLITGKTVGFAGICLENEKNEIIGYRGEPFCWDECVKSNYVDLNAFAHSSSHYKNDGAFDVSLKRMVDWDLILRYTKNSRPFYAPFIGCNYFESSIDKNRITMKEPRAFHKVVHLKNTIPLANPKKISDAIKLKFGIKIPAPYKSRNEWGDFHYAQSLKNSLEKQGHQVTLDFHGDWYKRPAHHDDVIIVLRGLHQYKPAPGPINIMWNISHPDQISYQEYEKFDMVYVPSYSYASFLATFLKTPVNTLLQCTDDSRFFYDKGFLRSVESLVLQKSNKVLFVGNSRNEYRKIVKDSIESGFDIHVYGTRWNQFIPPKYIMGENIDNTKLSQYYTDYGVTLNDHWESMRVYGFMSNRIFDVLASGGKLVSDSIPAITRVFGDAVAQVEDVESTHQAINRLLNNTQVFSAHKVSDYIARYHTFDSRAKTINNFVSAKLGLPLKFDKPNEYPMLNASGQNRKYLCLLCDNSSSKYMSEMYLRYISPLTSELANFHFDLEIINGIDNNKIFGCQSVIVNYDYFKSIDQIESFLSVIKKYELSFYLDAGVNLPLTDSLLDFSLIDRSNPMLSLLMSKAKHVFFSRDDLKYSCRGMYKSASTISYALDPRLWRDYRRAAPKANFVPKFRFLYNNIYNDSLDALEFLVSVFDGLVEKYKFAFELIVVSSSEVPEFMRPWLKFKHFDANQAYPHLAEYLPSLDTMDIGLFPAIGKLLNSNLLFVRFLEYSSSGMISIVSDIPATRDVINSGLAIGANNSITDWIDKIAFTLQNKKLHTEMIDAVWRYVWESNRFDQIVVNTIEPINTLSTTIDNPREVDVAVTSNRVAVCLHLYYVHLWSTIRAYLGNINKDFDLYITCPIDKYDDVISLVLPTHPKAVIEAVENKGMDIFPFLIVNKKYSLWRYDAVLKLHTKNDKSQDGAHFGKVCLDSLLGERKMIDNIIDKFLTDRFTGLVGPEILYRSALSLMYVNGPWVDKIFTTLNMTTPKQDWGFFAGTMFWISGSLLKDFADSHTDLELLLNDDTTVVTTGGDGSWAHAFERVFSAVARKLDFDIWLSYPVHIDGRHRRIRKINDSDELQAFSKYKISSMWYIPRHANLKKWVEILSNHKAFDADYYYATNGAIIPDGMDPIVHYLLFGDDLRLDPNSWFSTRVYRSNSMDVVKARISCLVHYLMNGKREGRIFNDS